MLGSMKSRHSIDVISLDGLNLKINSQSNGHGSDWTSTLQGLRTLHSVPQSRGPPRAEVGYPLLGTDATFTNKRAIRTV